MTMTNTEHVEAVVAWVRAELPEIQGGYVREPPAKDHPLPDVVGALREESMVMGDDPDLPWVAIQQAGARRMVVELSFMAEAGATIAQSMDAGGTLEDFAERLLASLASDPTLGQRVAYASPWSWAVDYDPAYVEYADGTRGRMMTAELVLGEPVGVED